jgi:hypothetical protein
MYGWPGRVLDESGSAPIRFRLDDVVKRQKPRQHSLLTANVDEAGNMRTGKDAFVIGARAACA